MGGGAVIAAAAAARRRRMQEVVDAFRMRGATAPERAATPDEIGVMHIDEAATLLERGVITPGPREGTFYLNEAAYIARRDQRRTGKKLIVLIALLVMMVALGMAMFAMRKQ